MSKIILITTGGTIASVKISKNQGAVPVLTGKELLKQSNFAAADIVDVIEFSNEDSSRLGPENWLQLGRLVTLYLNNSNISGIVITHGTDTLAETAYFLSLTMVATKPIILTGAMHPASNSSHNGIKNLKESLLLANSPFTSKEVQIFFNNKIISPYFVVKSHTSALNSLREINVDIPIEKINFELPEKLPKVPLITTFAGDDGSILDFVIKGNPNGIIIEALGSGNVNQMVAKNIQKAIRHKIKVVISSRIPYGEVKSCYGGIGGAVSLESQGAIISRRLRGDKARILLMLGLSNNLSLADLKKIF